MRSKKKKKKSRCSSDHVELNQKLKTERSMEYPKYMEIKHHNSKYYGSREIKKF